MPLSLAFRNLSNYWGILPDRSAFSRWYFNILSKYLSFKSRWHFECHPRQQLGRKLALAKSAHATTAYELHSSRLFHCKKQRNSVSNYGQTCKNWKSSKWVGKECFAFSSAKSRNRTFSHMHSNSSVTPIRLNLYTLRFDQPFTNILSRSSNLTTTYTGVSGMLFQQITST